MRRFINSLFGKAISQLALLALVMPFFQVIMASRAEAQLQTLPTWAVVDFEVRRTGGNDLGKVAADAVANELAKSGKYDVVPQESMKRFMEQLTLQPPVKDRTSLLRLASEARATTIVRGEVVNWRVRSEAGGKQADVILKVEVIDVASGLAVNGAALSASSPVRATSVDDTTVVSDAISSAAAQAVAEINMKTLPQGTVLNTHEQTALINQGARSGFKIGQQLIVLRGREQVASASVIEVEPDSATIRIERSSRGHQPGDKVRVIFAVDDVKETWSNTGSAQVVKPRRRGSNSGFTTMLLVAGVLGVLLGQGRSKGFTAAHNVKAEPMLFPSEAGSPANRVSWSRDLFVRGNQTTVQWQIHRSDVVGSPVLVVIGNESQGIDTIDARNVTYGDFGGVVGGFVCNNEAVPNVTVTGVGGVVPGRPYNYSVELVYKVASIDLPDGGNTTTTTTGGTTGGNTTGGNTTGGTGANECFFVSPRAAAQGTATPLNPATLTSPASNAVISADQPFQFGSVVNPAFPITAQYVLQISWDPLFPKSRTRTYAKLTRTDTGTLSTGPIDLFNNSGQFNPGLDLNSSSQEWFWRIGAKNVGDKPGPVPDANGERFVFSPPRRFTIPSPPPPPPVE